MPRPSDPARAAARQSGTVLYVSAKGCKRDHAAPLERYTSTGACRQCVAGRELPPPVTQGGPVDPLAAVIG
jgi:hypothetical protein